MKQLLQPEEEIVFEAHPSRITLIPLTLLLLAWVIGMGMVWVRTAENVYLLVLIIVAALLLIRILQRLIVLGSSKYLVTDRRVIKRTGLLTHNSIDSYLDKVNNVEHRQTLWGRMLGYGDVEIDTASETGMTRFPMIADPIGFKNAVLGAMEKYRSSRFGIVQPQPISHAQKIRDLKQLLDDGLISSEEFESKRKQLLETM